MDSKKNGFRVWVRVLNLNQKNQKTPKPEPEPEPENPKNSEPKPYFKAQNVENVGFLFIKLLKTVKKFILCLIYFIANVYK